MSQIDRETYESLKNTRLETECYLFADEDSNLDLYPSNMHDMVKSSDMFCDVLDKIDSDDISYTEDGSWRLNIVAENQINSDDMQFFKQHFREKQRS